MSKSPRERPPIDGCPSPWRLTPPPGTRNGNTAKVCILTKLLVITKFGKNHLYLFSKAFLPDKPARFLPSIALSCEFHGPSASLPSPASSSRVNPTTSKPRPSIPSPPAPPGAHPAWDRGQTDTRTAFRIPDGLADSPGRWQAKVIISEHSSPAG